MRTAILCLAAAFTAATAAEGGLEQALNKKAVSCWDIGYNAGELMPKARASGHHDSLAAIATYWENKCGMTEPLWRFNLLQNIGADKPPVSPTDTDVVDEMLYYKNRIESHWEHPESRARVNEYYNYSPPAEFDDMTYAMAEGLAKDSRTLDRDDSLLTLFYQNKFLRFFEEVYGREGGKVSEAFRKRVVEERNRKMGNVGLITGIWIPTGKASLLGSHPVFGFYGGAQGTHWGLDGNMHFRFMESDKPYHVMHKDTLRASKHFFGGYIGVDGFYENPALVRGKILHPYFIFGLAADGFDTYEGKGKNDNESIFAPSFNIGLANRFFYSQSGYLSLEARYHLVAYDNEGGTDLSGFPVSILLKWGFMDNVPARNALKNLGYTR